MPYCCSSIFIKNKVKINVIDRNKKTLLFYAIASQNVETQRCILLTDIKPGTLSEAVFDGNIEEVYNRFSSKNCNFRTSFVWTIFHLAAYNNNHEMILMELVEEIQQNSQINCGSLKFDVRRMVNITTKDLIGMTPLHIATIMNATETVNELMDMDINVGVLDHDLSGNKPLYYCKNDEIGVRLVEHELQENITCNTKQIAETVYRRINEEDSHNEHINEPSKECVVVLENNSYIGEETIDVTTQTFEHIFNLNQKPSLWYILYIVFANVQLFAFTTQFFRKKIDRVDNNGDTILHIASRNDCISPYKVLLSKGANPFLYNLDGCLPFQKSGSMIGNLSSLRFFQLNNFLRRFALKELTILKIVLIVCLSTSVIFNMTSYITLKVLYLDYGHRLFGMFHMFSVLSVFLISFFIKIIRLKKQHTFHKDSFCGIYLFISFKLIQISTTENIRDFFVFDFASCISKVICSLLVLAIYELVCAFLKQLYYFENYYTVFRILSLLILAIVGLGDCYVYVSIDKINQIVVMIDCLKMTPYFVLCFIMCFVSMVFYIICLPAVIYLLLLNFIKYDTLYYRRFFQFAKIRSSFI